MREGPKGPLGIALAGALWLAGCGGSATRDHDADADTDAPVRGTVTISTDDPLVLYFREEAAILGDYLDSGGNGASVYLESSLQGNAHDTTLDTTSVLSGDDGSFSFTLTAGTLDAEFVLRVEAEDGAQDEIHVQVTESATDDLSVNAGYSGRRRIDVFEVLTTNGDATDCPVLSGDPVMSTETEDDTLPFTVGLPEATSVALLLIGSACPTEEDECLDWIFGCEEGIVLEVGLHDSTLVILQDDLGTFSAPYFDVEHSIDTSSYETAWIDTMLGPLRDMTIRDDDPAHFLLDGIHGKIVAEYGTSSGDLFVSTRISSNLDSTLDGALDAAGLDMEAEIDAIAHALAGVFDPLELEGTLEGDFWGELEQRAVHGVERMGGAGGMAETSGLLAADPAEAEVTVSYYQDLVGFDSYSLPVGLGEALLGLIEAVVVPGLMSTAPGSTPVPVEDYVSDGDDVIDCRLVAQVIVEEETLGTIASLAWYETACEQVIGDVAAGMRAEAEVLDSTHPALVISGECDFLDASGYAREARSCEGSLTSVSWGVDALAGNHALILAMPL